MPGAAVGDPASSTNPWSLLFWAPVALFFVQACSWLAWGCFWVSTLASLVAMPALVLWFRVGATSAPGPPLVTFGWGPVLCRLTNCVRFCKDPVGTIRAAHLRSGCASVFTLPVLWMRLTFFVGKKAQGFLAKKHDNEASTFEAYRDWTIPLFGEGVIYDNREQFLEQRDMIKNIVHSGMRSFTPKIEEEYELYVESKGWLKPGLKGGAVVVDIMDMMSEVVLRSAGRCLLGKGVGSARQQTGELQELSTLFHDLDEGLSALAFIMPKRVANLFPSVQRQCKARLALESFFRGIADKRRAARRAAAAAAGKGDDSMPGEGGAEDEDEECGFLEKLLTQRYKNGDAIQDWEVGRLMIAALFAGQHTSAIAGAYAGLHMVDGQKDGGKLMAALMAEQRGEGGEEREEREERAAVGEDPATAPAQNGSNEEKDSDGFVQLCKKSVDQMHLLGGVLLESIRLHPPLIMVMRKALCPLPFDPAECVVPAGDMCCMSTAYAGMLPEVWGQDGADRIFDPRRFGAGNRYETNGEFLGFGHGLHKCPGKAFALLDLKVLWSRLLRDFEVEQVDPLPSEDYAQLVVGPKKPCRVRLLPRSGRAPHPSQRSLGELPR